MYRLIKNKFSKKTEGCSLELYLNTKEQNKIIKELNLNNYFNNPIENISDDYDEKNNIDFIINENDDCFNLFEKEPDMENIDGYILMSKVNDSINIGSIYLKKDKNDILLIKNFKEISFDFNKTLKPILIEKGRIEIYDKENNHKDENVFYIPINKCDIYEIYETSYLKKIYEAINFGLSLNVIILILILIFK